MDRHEFFRIVGTSVGAILLTRYVAGCAGQGGSDPTPSQKVDFTVRLDDKDNANLKVKGGYVIANGIIIAQTKDGQFVAVSADCTCTDQGTRLIFKPADNQFYCPLHLSRFDITGKVVVGPAVRPLTQYTVNPDLTAGTVRVHN